MNGECPSPILSPKTLLLALSYYRYCNKRVYTKLGLNEQNNKLAGTSIVSGFTLFHQPFSIVSSVLIVCESSSMLLIRSRSYRVSHIIGPTLFLLSRVLEHIQRNFLLPLVSPRNFDSETHLTFHPM